MAEKDDFESNEVHPSNQGRDKVPMDDNTKATHKLDEKASSQESRRSCIASDLKIFKSEGRLIEDMQVAIRWAQKLRDDCNLVTQPIDFYIEAQNQIYACADRLRNRLGRLNFPDRVSNISGLPDNHQADATVLSHETTLFLNELRSVFGRKSLLVFDVPPKSSIRDRQEWQLNFLAGWKPRNPTELAQAITIDPDGEPNTISNWTFRQQSQAITLFERPKWVLLPGLSSDGHLNDWIDRLFAHQYFLHATEEALVTANYTGSICLKYGNIPNLDPNLQNLYKHLIDSLRELHCEIRDLRNIPRPKIHD